MSFGSKSLDPPTPDQLRRWGLIRAKGCIACIQLRPDYPMIAEIHHQTVGGKHGAPRLGHDFTIGLCWWHHRGVTSGNELIEHHHGPSYALTPKAFRREFGSDADLLAAQNCLIGWTIAPKRERSARKPFRKPRRGSQCVASEKAAKRRV